MTPRNSRNFWQEFPAIRRHFFKGLKDWKILREHVAYGSITQERMKFHKMAVEVEAIAVIHQYDYKNGHPPFEVC